MHQDWPGRLEYALLAFLGGLIGLSVGLLGWQVLAPEPLLLLGLTIDRLSAVMTLLVAGIGTVAYRFALRYLDGEHGHRRFLHWLCFTISMAYLLMLSTNLLLLFCAWSLTSVGLHQLLTFYRDRPEAQRPARKKFIISRLGDVALLAAFVMIWLHWNTYDLSTLVERINNTPTESATLTIVALLIVVAALTKSAQFPFHSWLPETMEAPTPVSALMHAGIINAGGVLLLRFAPLIAHVPSALFVLVAVGTITSVLGMIVMWAQTDAKRTLAWSTVSQMGFMMIQCGLGAFAVAALHIVGHGCYKAWSFLRTGDLPVKTTSYAPATPNRSIVLSMLGTLLAVPFLVLASTITGFDPAHSPGELALTAIVALSIGQLWAALFRRPLHDKANMMSRAAGGFLLTCAVSLVAFVLYRGTTAFLTPALGSLPISIGLFAWITAALPVVAFASLGVLHALLPTFGRSARGRAFYVHALNGFYLGIIANRIVDRIWTGVALPKRAGTQPGGTPLAPGRSTHA